MKPLIQHNAFSKAWLIAALITVLVACSHVSPSADIVAVPKVVATSLGADSIYFGGNIITVNDTQPSVEAIAIKDGRIVAVGTREEVERTRKGEGTQLIDLAGKTMVPGFVDAHSHFSEVGQQTIFANLRSPPGGPVDTIPALQQALRDLMATSPTVKAHRVVAGTNYDDRQLVERRHPTRQELDAVSTEMPVVVVHYTGHVAVFNSKALAMAGITPATPDPAGGVIERESDGKTPNGVLQETAFFVFVPKLAPQYTHEERVAQLQTGEAHYIANGFTTVQDGKTNLTTLKALPEMANAGAFKIDIVSYADIVQTGDDPILHGPLMSRGYTNHFRIGGIKLTLDGSALIKTAWLTQPYFKVPVGQNESYAGYPAFTDAEALKWFSLAYRNNWQVLTHSNGDATIDQVIRVVRAAEAATPGDDRRTVLVHGQLMRADQVAPLKELGIFPTLFPLHTSYWGDYYRDSAVGPERAENISPTGWMLAQDMKFSIHTDAPVTPPDSMRLLDNAVNRTTRSGHVLGLQQRIEPMVALKAMTIWPTYQHFEEATKGSIEVGKLADLVVLSDNPLAVDRSKLKDIKVIETIKEGATIYRRVDAAATVIPTTSCAPSTECAQTSVATE